MNSNQENIDLISLWKTQDAKLDKIIELNQELIKLNIETKAKNELKGLKTIRIVGIVLGILWTNIICLVLFKTWFFTNWFFKSSFIIHVAVTVYAIGQYIYHLGLLNSVDRGNSILTAQENLIKLRNANLRTLGILWLQLPVFSMWFMSDTWKESNPTTFWYVQFPLVLIQAGIGVWLFKNMDVKNVDKKWFKWFMSKGEFLKISQAQELLNQIEAID